MDIFYLIYNKIIEKQIEWATKIVEGKIEPTKAGKELDKFLDMTDLVIPSRVRLLYHIIGGRITDIIKSLAEKIK